MRRIPWVGLERFIPPTFRQQLAPNCTDWGNIVRLLEQALKRWAHDEDLVAWLRRTLCEMGAGHCN